jgi:hypothetical protein
MSLISEALRKARQEAAGRGAERRGPKVPSGWDRPPSGTRMGAGLVLGAVIALAAALAGAAAVWWAVGRTNDGAVATEVKVAEAPAGSAPAAEQEVPADPQVDGRSVTPAPAAASTTSDFSPDDPGVAEAAGRVPARVDAIEPALGGEEDGESPPRPDSTGEVAGSTPGSRVFVIDADLGDVELTLDLIVFRAEDPWAEINGLEVHVGSRVEGLLVEEIARDYVRLSDESGEVILRAR